MDRGNGLHLELPSTADATESRFLAQTLNTSRSTVKIEKVGRHSTYLSYTSPFYSRNPMKLKSHQILGTTPLALQT